MIIILLFTCMLQISSGQNPGTDLFNQSMLATYKCRYHGTSSLMLQKKWLLVTWVVKNESTCKDSLFILTNKYNSFSINRLSDAQVASKTKTSKSLFKFVRCVNVVFNHGSTIIFSNVVQQSFLPTKNVEHNLCLARVSSWGLWSPKASFFLRFARTWLLHRISQWNSQSFHSGGSKILRVIKKSRAVVNSTQYSYRGRCGHLSFRFMYHGSCCHVTWTFGTLSLCVLLKIAIVLFELKPQVLNKWLTLLICPNG
jgi:hypothetical protein